MTLGERIAKLRNECGYSQEYIAEQLEVSRQAVSKWEKGLSSPDTENLIKLAEVLNTSVQFLATGKDFYFPEGKPIAENKKFKITKENLPKIIKISIISIIVVFLSVFILFGFFAPAEYDSGACSGGYRTFLFDKYSDTLTEKFVANLEKSEERHPDFVSAVPYGESTDMTSAKRNIWLTFSIVCETKSGNEYAYLVTFKGKRIWYDTYIWTTVTIVDSDSPYI